MRWRNYDQVFGISMRNKNEYAEKHGYKTFDGSYLIDTSRPPSWTKIKALQRLLYEEECDWAVWMDADTVIMNKSILFESFLPSDEKYDMLCTKDSPNTGYNSGVLIFRNSEWSKQFLEDWWNMKSYVRPPGFSLSGDNTALKALLKSTEDFDEHVLVPTRCTFNSFARFFTHRQNRLFSLHLSDQEWYMSTDYYHKGDFVAHVAGIDNKAGALQLLVKQTENR
jgi:mannan polymerase II complex MNN10 subunit